MCIAPLGWSLEFGVVWTLALAHVLHLTIIIAQVFQPEIGVQNSEVNLRPEHSLLDVSIEVKNKARVWKSEFGSFRMMIS